MGSRSKDPKRKRRRYYERLETKGGHMPKRWIEFPPETNPLINTVTKQPLKGDDDKPLKLDMKEVMDTLWSHPIWNEGLDQAEAQDSIMRAFDEAWGKDPGMWIAEADWKFLDMAAKNPKIQLPNGAIQPGLGRLPFMARVYVPYLKAITAAKTEAEKEKMDREKAEREKESNSKTQVTPAQASA